MPFTAVGEIAERLASRLVGIGLTTLTMLLKETISFTVGGVKGFGRNLIYY